jgi:type IX secretion system PorP/SprF family membrane protein
MKKGFLIILIVCFCGKLLPAQDIHFSQINNTPLILNPSLTGNFDGDVRAVINAKQQWQSITIPYQTLAASLDMSLFRKKWKEDYMGAGLSFFTDKAGDASMGTTQVNASLSFNRGIDKKNNVLFGIEGGWGQRSFDITKLTWDNQYNGSAFDPTLPSNEPPTVNNNFSYIDFAAGGSWAY